MLNLICFLELSLLYRLAERKNIFESMCFVSFRLLLTVRAIFEFLLCDLGKANATHVIGDLAPFLWRAKQMFCVTSLLDQLTAASSKFSVSMEAGCSPFAWARCCVFATKFRSKLSMEWFLTFPQTSRGRFVFALVGVLK